MSISAKLLVVAFALALIMAVGWNYSAFFVERDYLIYTEISCEPEDESCFAWVCEEGDEECDDSPYKKITFSAAYAPLCDIYTDEECPEPSCDPLDTECEILYCAEDTLEEGEVCVEPDEEVSEAGEDLILEEDSESTEEAAEVTE